MADTQPRICIVIRERDWLSVDRAVADAAGHHAMIEIRLDFLEAKNLNDLGPLNRILSSYPQSTIITLRPTHEGGHSRLSIEARLKFWLNLGLQLPSTYVDLERDLVERLWRSDAEVDWSRVISSYHNPRETPADLDEKFDDMIALPARLLKIAVCANDAVESLKIFDLLDRARRASREMIAISLGEAGVMTRILGPARGNFLTYASLSHDRQSAVGQLTVEELSEVYAVDRISTETLITGVVGQPVAHSISPHIQNAAFRNLGIDAVYVPFDVNDLDAFFKRMVHPRTREIKWPMRGLSITSPHKARAMRHLDWIDPLAAEIAAVNTVVIEDHRLCGYNTDAEAFLLPLKKRVASLKDSRVAIIGAGGVANAAVYILQREQANVVVFARDFQKARQFCDRWAVECRDLRNANFAGFDIVINATPLGTRGVLERDTPAGAEQLRGARLAYDLVYNPLVTQFMTEAEAAGCDTVDGLEMFLEQAARQFELWIGQPPEYDVMRMAAMKVLTKPHSIGA